MLQKHDWILFRPFGPVDHGDPCNGCNNRFEDAPEEFLKPGPAQAIQNLGSNPTNKKSLTEGIAQQTRLILREGKIIILE